MKADPTRMPARYFALLCDVLKERGVAVESMLENAKIWPTQIYGPDATLTVTQLEALIAEAQRATGRSDLGFELGRAIKLSSHEILGYGIITSPTLDYAMQLAARYYRLITPTFGLQYHRDRSKSELRFQPAVSLSPQAMQFMMETIVVSAHEQIKSLMAQRLPAYDIYVSYDEPANARHYRELKPARFHFGAERLPGARMAIDVETIAQALPMADRSALTMAESRCEELLRRATQSRGMTEWITMMLREAHQGMPTLAELAHLLNQSPRTLDRHLGREGKRFLDISKQIRHEKACALLKASSLSITQVAYQLGYKDAANFTRAFRRECGASPREYVKSANSGPRRNSAAR
jgi:AraC-like DNA-binding protein